MPDLDPVLESMPLGFIGIDGDWRVSYINAAGESVVGKTREEMVGASYWEVFPANVDNDFGRSYREVVATGVAQTVESFYPEPLNRWFEVHAVPAHPGLALYFAEVTARRTAQDRLAMLARVSAELSGTLDIGPSVDRVPRLLTPVLGDGCVLTAVDDDGRPSQVSSWHVDPARRALLEQYTALRLAGSPGGTPAVRSFAGERVIATRAELLELLPEGRAKEVFRRLAPRAGLTLPLLGRERLVGVLTLFSDRWDSADDADLATAQDVAGRIGLALDNARLFVQQRKLAEGLQRSLLTEPFEPDHAEIVVRYIPAGEVAQVGGDWYDAFLQPSGATMLVIGDVVGHDTEAAAAMGQLRSLLRGIAVYSDGGPAEVLRGLDAAITQLQVQAYATAAIARFEQTREEVARGVTRMRWSNAGHLPRLVLHPDGSLADLADWQGDLLLGVDPDTARRESVVTLERGSTVVLFTDGLIERRNEDLDTGMARLRAAAADLADLALPELCDQLVHRLVDGRPQDDVAVVAIRLHPQDRPRPAAAGPVRVPPTVPADPADAG